MQKLSFSQRAFFAAYTGLWRALRPVLARHKRLKHGFEERLVPYNWASHCDIWIQAASGGEAYLVWEFLRHLPHSETLAGYRILLTSCTVQGYEILEKARKDCTTNRADITLEIRFFPLDEPNIMRRALEESNPRLVLVMETELWPSLMLACKERDVPFCVVNGRMRQKSFTQYRYLAKLLRKLAPASVLAISQADAERFSTLFALENVQVMSNVKFDRIAEQNTAPNPLFSRQALTSDACPIVALASVREEEEQQILDLCVNLHNAHPHALIALVPRHLERADFWKTNLNTANIPWRLRSSLKLTQGDALKTAENGGEHEEISPLSHAVASEKNALSGGVIIWDSFGELLSVYAHSDVVFVGGSLAPLGGQNFLEPLSFGVSTITGASWYNFAWVGEEIFAPDMLAKVDNADELFWQIDAHLQVLASLPQEEVLQQKEARRARFARFVESRRGGTAQAVATLISYVEKREEAGKK